MQRALVLLATVFLQYQVNANQLSEHIKYYPEDFYSEVEHGVRGEPLKEELFAILSKAHIESQVGADQLKDACHGESTCFSHVTLGYNQARRILFGELHLSQQGGKYAIKDVYCDSTVTSDDFRTNPPGPDKIPDPNILNAEHTWPQSRFTRNFNRETQKSDLHILFPAISSANSSRGNLEFGDVVTEMSSPCPKSRRGHIAKSSNKTFFEAPNYHKGNVARALFYFSTRYKVKISPLEEDTLREWNRLDPVDQAERDRNDAIFAKQKVRNPFIDYPELVEMIQDF